MLPAKARAVFVSYAHTDNESEDPKKRWLDRFVEFLRPLIRQEDFTLCSDKDIKIGQNWHEHIQAHLNGAKAVVLLVSPAFLASDYIADAADNGVRLFPILISPSLFKRAKYRYPDPKMGPQEFTLASLQAANAPSKTLVEMTEGEQNRVLEDVADQLWTCLRAHQVISDDKLPRDPYCNYLERLYDRVNRYLAAKLTRSLRDQESRPEPIRLSTEVDVLFDPLFAVGGIAGEAAREFKDFSNAFDYYDGRVCLLGAPGAGKTITLLHYARDAILQRRQNISAPLPILGIIPDWNPAKQPSVVAWLDDSKGAPANASEFIRSGQALLLLDGLDELGDQREDPETKDKYDPRLRFIQQIPDNNRILITCRTSDYAAIGEKLRLGAITLKPLTDTQMHSYLRVQKELLDFVQLDVKLKEWLRTPLLLSFFAFSYEGLSVSEREKLLAIKSHGDLRDKIYARYTEQRFEHERHKIRSVAFTLDDIYEFLGACAIFSGYQISRSADAPGALGNASCVATAFDNVRRRLGMDAKDYMQQLANLHLLISEGETFSFIHPTLRDYFAYTYAVKSFRIYEQGVPNDIESGFSRGWGFRLVRCIEELEQLMDYRALPHIISQRFNALDTKREMIVGDHADYAVQALLKSAAQSRSTECIDMIAEYLFPVSEVRGYVRPEPIDAQVAAALELIGSPEALMHVHAWRQEASPELRARADRIKQEWATPASDCGPAPG